MKNQRHTPDPYIVVSGEKLDLSWNEVEAMVSDGIIRKLGGLRYALKRGVTFRMLTDYINL